MMMMMMITMMMKKKKYAKYALQQWPAVAVAVAVYRN